MKSTSPLFTDLERQQLLKLFALLERIRLAYDREGGRKSQPERWASQTRNNSPKRI